MKKAIQLMLAVMFVAGMTHLAVAGGEHGGKEHGGDKPAAKEHGGEKKGSAKDAHGHAEPSNEDIRNTMKAYVVAQTEAHSGNFKVKDVDTGETRNLTLINVHERVGKTGDNYYSCADFKDVDSGEELDLDLDVVNNHGVLSVTDVRIHKVSGEPRYTYDDNDNRVPLKEGTKSHLGSKGKGSGKMEMKGSSKEPGSNEHGGNEHGGN
ncbi:hypothetical protein MNBD_UNCLBAC01-1196 [hydrothermal vent metagenome]|uniref:Uncharacterized protein n=1 Tax=hydrothermal vent metagenome TaxID=652676 RepID=A0A3B1E0T2_9ZZZZ